MAKATTRLPSRRRTAKLAPDSCIPIPHADGNHLIVDLELQPKPGDSDQKSLEF